MRTYKKICRIGEKEQVDGLRVTPDVRKKQYAGALLGSPPVPRVDDDIYAPSPPGMPRWTAAVVHSHREPRRWQTVWPERDRNPEPVGPVRPALRRIILVLPL